jgi:hypothetical protein
MLQRDGYWRDILKRPIWVATIVVAAAGAFVGGTTAFGMPTAIHGGEAPVTAAKYYANDASLEEISTASQGKPGEVAPPCPDAATVSRLKAEGLPIGPCDPLPESGDPVVLPEQGLQTADEVPESASSCAVVFVHSLKPNGSSRIEGPCGPGARITNVEPFTNASGVECAKVSYMVADVRGQAASICAGDPYRATQPNFVSKGD